MLGDAGEDSVAGEEEVEPESVGQKGRPEALRLDEGCRGETGLPVSVELEGRREKRLQGRGNA